MEELAIMVEGKRERSVATYCVTGATGYIGSWLVKALLERGYMVHATVRDPAKSLHLLSLWTGGDRLRIFQADLHQEGSFDKAIKGCDGVFHVAASMEFDVHVKENVGNPCMHCSNLANRILLETEWFVMARLQDSLSFHEVAMAGLAIAGHSVLTWVRFQSSLKRNLPKTQESFVRTNIIDPAIKGTLNLLNACLKSKSVKRVVFTSSISTITAKYSNGKWRPVVDESCQIPIDHVWNTKASGWVYVVSKLLTEQAAFRIANENGIDLVSVITTTVAGPFLTSSVPSSIQVLLSPITGDSKFFSILSAVNTRMGSIALVHIEDICNAHIFLMEQPKAQGHYICSACSCLLSELVNHLNQKYPFSNIQKLEGEREGSVTSVISSKKLRDLGFDYKHGIEDIIRQTIDACVDNGFLAPIKK